MRYCEFRDVMIGKGYSSVDVFDCIRDFFKEHEISKMRLDQFVALFCDNVCDRNERLNRHYAIDDAFDKLIDKYFAENDFYKNRSIDDVFDDICSDLWDYCRLGYLLFADYWQDCLKDC